MIDRIGVVPLYVSDQDTFIDFYTNKLGFELRTDAEMWPGARWVEVGLAGRATTFAILAATDFPDVPARSDSALLHTSDIATTYEELKAKGVEISEPTKEPWGTFSTIVDPDGHNVLVSEVAEKYSRP